MFPRQQRASPGVWFPAAATTLSYFVSECSVGYESTELSGDSKKIISLIFIK